MDWPIAWLVGWSVGRLVGWSVGRLVGWSVGRLVGWSVGQRDNFLPVNSDNLLTKKKGPSGPFLVHNAWLELVVQTAIEVSTSRHIPSHVKAV